MYIQAASYNCKLPNGSLYRLDDEIIETDCVEEFKQKLAPSMYVVK